MKGASGPSCAFNRLAGIRRDPIYFTMAAFISFALLLLPTQMMTGAPKFAVVFDPVCGLHFLINFDVFRKRKPVCKLLLRPYVPVSDFQGWTKHRARISTYES